MMTVDDAVAEAAVAIDEVLKQRWDALALKMIGDGLNPADRGDLGSGPPPGGLSPGLGWSRLTFDEVLQQQKDLDLAWRAEALDRVRAAVLTWLTTRSPT